MLEAAASYFEKHKVKPKRDALVKQCVDILECRYEDAQLAYSELPEKYGENGEIATGIYDGLTDKSNRPVCRPI